jgi:cytochrome P450
MALQRPPGPKFFPIIGGLIEMRRTDPPTFFLNLARKHGDVVWYRLAGTDVYQLSHPDHIQELLVSNIHTYNKGDLDKRILRQTLGNGLLLSDGDFWKRQRKLVAPAFHANRIASYAETMVDFTGKVMSGWTDGTQIEMHREMTRLTLFIVSKTLYDADVTESADGIGELVTTLAHIGNKQYVQGFVPPSWLPIPQVTDARQAVQALNGIIMPIIEARRRSGEDRGDLLSMLLMAQDEDGSQMSDQQVRDEAVTLFLAGHETTSNALSWAWALLSQHPEAEARLHAELDSVLEGRTPTFADLPKLPFTDAVFKEAMRLYPPAWALTGRQPQEDVQLAGYTIPKNSVVITFPYVVHRDSRWFENPDAFRPERWLDGLEKRIPKYAYFPFGGGPRVCVGNQFALMEGKLILAAMASRYRFCLTQPGPIGYDAAITLRPKGGLPMRVERRVNHRGTEQITEEAQRVLA